MHSLVKLPYLAYLPVYHIFLQILLQHLSGIHVWRAQLDTPNQQHSVVKNSLVEFYRQVASELTVPEQLHVWVTITELCKWQLQDRHIYYSTCKTTRVVHAYVNLILPVLLYSILAPKTLSSICL